MVEWVASNPAQPSKRKLRLFAVGCCRLVWDQIEGVAERRLVELVEEEAEYPERRVDIELTRRVPIVLTDNSRPGFVTFLLHGIIEPRASTAAYTAAWCAPKFGTRGSDSYAVYQLVRDVFGNPFRPVAFNPAWRTDTALSLAQQMYESRDFGAMPILADALQDAGCDSEEILNHCRDATLTHVRGCWVVDLVLGK
jgi:hypothetical protein